MIRDRRAALGIAFVLVATACFATGDNLIKLTGAAVPVVFLIWVRYAVQAGAMALWLAPRGWRGFRTAHPRFQIGRGTLLLLTSALGFYGLQRMPTGEFTALGLLAPVVVTALVATVLREPISALRWALVWGGFAGGLIVIRPGSGVFGWAALFPLAMALSYGSFQVVTSRLAGLESPYLTHFYTGLVGFVVLTPLLIASGTTLGPALASAPALDLVLVFLIGGLLTGGHLLLIFAFERAPIATLIPFLYAQIAFAMLVGWALFRHLPDGWVWVGIGVIALCGASSAWLNAGAAAPRPASVVAADTLYD